MKNLLISSTCTQALVIQYLIILILCLYASSYSSKGFFNKGRNYLHYSHYQSIHWNTDMSVLHPQICCHNTLHLHRVGHILSHGLLTLYNYIAKKYHTIIILYECHKVQITKSLLIIQSPIIYMHPVIPLKDYIQWLLIKMEITFSTVSTSPSTETLTCSFYILKSVATTHSIYTGWVTFYAYITNKCHTIIPLNFIECHNVQITTLYLDINI